mmetsp:Transcript_6104/g.11871  ORF Transcript_6104/g.11871 Transcript_6104/m.11871 type:complete len:649 (-) Transcript_6104:96-2042(-)
MPFNVSEEQSLLHSMLTERDAQISTLTHQLHSTSEILHTTQKELQSKSSARKAQREEHSATIKRLKEEHAEQRRILAKFEQNVKNGGGLRVHEYAALMRSANSNRVESSYVIRLQAQLCRAMHSLGVMESQLALVKENCSSLIKFMKEDLSHMVDDRTRREIELMNGLARVDNEKRVMAEEMEAKMQEKEELLDQVREEYEELGLEYDENEVKKALEVKYLLEQMEKVREDKVRLERELLAALLEREEQINRLRGETEELESKLDVLNKEAERRDIRYGENAAASSEDSDDVEVLQEEDNTAGQPDAEDIEEKGGEAADGQEDANSGAAPTTEVAEKGEEVTEGQEDVISDVISPKDENPLVEETKPTTEEESSQNEGIDADAANDGIVEATSTVGTGHEQPATTSPEDVTTDKRKASDSNDDEKETTTKEGEGEANVNKLTGDDTIQDKGGSEQEPQEMTAASDPEVESNNDDNVDDGKAASEQAETQTVEKEEDKDNINESNGDDAIEDETESEQQPQEAIAASDSGVDSSNDTNDDNGKAASEKAEEQTTGKEEKDDNNINESSGDNAIADKNESEQQSQEIPAEEKVQEVDGVRGAEEVTDDVAAVGENNAANATKESEPDVNPLPVNLEDAGTDSTEPSKEDN